MAFYDSIKLEKGMYNTARTSFTEVLEKLDPSENYEGTELEGLDAYQRQLKRFDIKVSGPSSDCVEKFFESYDSAVLFPEYMARAVKQGMETDSLLSSIVATTTKIEGTDYRAIAASSEDFDPDLAAVSEAAQIPSITVKSRSNLVTLNKRGKIMATSYEALRFNRLDILTVMLKQIGTQIAHSHAASAIDTIISGDGNSNPATVISSATTGTLTYADLISLWGGISPYELNTIIASTATMKNILALNEMKDSSAGLNFHGTGKLVTPLGANLIHFSEADDNKIIGLDKNCALEMIQAGDLTVEYDKVIDKQLERACISSTVGFSKIFTGASKVLSYATSV